MRVTVVAVGRDRDAALRRVFDEYVRRCPWPIRLTELRSADRPTDELARLRNAIPPGAAVIALDERGCDLDSAKFAARIAEWRNAGRGDLAFLIGGPDGLPAPLPAQADLVLALGRMTWPHRLVKVLLVEQLYRASTILAGHPYHRG